MFMRKKTLFVGSALGTIITLGAISTTTVGQSYHGNNMPGDYRHNIYSHGQENGHFVHPVYGHSFKHPVYGYQFKHPVYGYMPMHMHNHNPGTHGGNVRGCEEMKAEGYFVKTSSHATGGQQAAGGQQATLPQQDVVEVAIGAGSFNTLVTAIKAADLVETLRGPGPFTVFAPSDEAFAKIPKSDLDSLLADKEKLTAVLTYHVVPGKLMAEDVVKITEATTVQGASVRIDTTDGVKVDNAKVVKTDIMASNGVIHVIDAVIFPE